MKNHLKRIASPWTWAINRKENKFIVRPNPGAHPFSMGLPLGVVLRDFLQFASTTREAKKVLSNKSVLIDGKRRKDHRFIVGLFDTISFLELKKYYRLVLDKKGRLTLIEISAKESAIKICKVVGKAMVRGGKVQLNLHDGKNILVDKKVKVGDSVLLTLPQLEVREIFPLRPDSIVFLTKGNHSGGVGKLKELKEKEAIYSSGEEDIETARAYLFVVGDKEACIQLREGDKR